MALLRGNINDIRLFCSSISTISIQREPCFSRKVMFVNKIDEDGPITKIVLLSLPLACVKMKNRDAMKIALPVLVDFDNMMKAYQRAFEDSNDQIQEDLIEYATYLVSDQLLQECTLPVIVYDKREPDCADIKTVQCRIKSILKPTPIFGFVS